jgi:hypothetical protein
LINETRLREALDPGGLHYPKAALPMINKARTPPRYDSVKATDWLPIASALTAIYGTVEKSAAIEDAFGGDNSGWPLELGLNLKYTYCNAAVRVARAAGIRPSAELQRGWSVSPGLLEGRGIRHYLDRSDDERELDVLVPTNVHAGALATNLSGLSAMWVFGGSDSWPLDRIEHEWDRVAAAIRSLPGYAPTS